MGQPAKEFTTTDLAAAELNSQQVNQEQVFAAALFAKQLQADLTSIKKAQVGDGIRVPDVDMSKVMPSHIYKTFRPAGSPGYVPSALPASNPVQVPVGVPVVPVLPPQPDIHSLQVNTSQPTVVTSPISDTNQLEFNFNKVTRYEDVVEAIERLENKINSVNEKLDLLLLDGKKKLKPTQTKNGTQAG